MNLTGPIKPVTRFGPELLFLFFLSLFLFGPVD
jgi:hypothetical protein